MSKTVYGMVQKKFAFKPGTIQYLDNFFSAKEY